MTTASATREGVEELSPDQLELAARAVAEQQLRRLNAEGAARGASELERLVRKWEDEEVAVRRLMDGQQKMFARMVDGAPVGPMVLESQTPTPTDGLEPSTPDGMGNRQAASPGSGLLLTPSLSLISASPNVRASPVMRRSMDLLMARQAKIWQQVADTLGTRVSVMLSSPPLKVPSHADARGAIQSELPALPPISESIDQLKAIYRNASPNNRRFKRELARPKPRTLSDEAAADNPGAEPSAPPRSPVRKLAAELSKQAMKDTSAQHSSTTAQKQVKRAKKTKKAKRHGAEDVPRAEWNGRLRPDSPPLKLPLLGRPRPASDSELQTGRAGVGPVRTHSRRPDGADPSLESTQLENKWDEIRNLMVRHTRLLCQFACKRLDCSPIWGGYATVCTAQNGLQDGWEPGAYQGVCLPQLVSKVAQQQPPSQQTLQSVLDQPSRRKKDAKAAKWRRKAEANRKKQQEAKNARLLHARNQHVR